MSLLYPKKYRQHILVFTLFASILLAGCQKELYRNLNEQDANQMMVALLRAGVPAEKTTPDSGKTWTVTAEEGQVVQAMEVLRANGLPQKQFADLGEIFKKEGLVSTPTQERVRFIYGVSQELSHTLSEIDGVISARVHIVLPNNDPLAQNVQPSSASIFIKYRPDANVTSLVSQIKNLVAHSVEGLEYEQVSVTTVPADPIASAMSQKKGWSVWSIVPLIALGVCLVVSAGLYIWWRVSGGNGPIWQAMQRMVATVLRRSPKKVSENQQADGPSAS